MTRTRVVSVRVSEIRPEYDNLREWRKDSNNKYIGRQGLFLLMAHDIQSEHHSGQILIRYQPR